MISEPSMEHIWRSQGAALSLDHLGLASRPFHLLVRHGISLERLLTLSSAVLLALKNLGEGSVRNIEACLADSRLSPAPDPPAPIDQRRVAAAERGRALHERH